MILFGAKSEGVPIFATFLVVRVCCSGAYKGV